MTNLIIKPVTMSSREIAELTGKNHFDVMRDIRKMLEALGKDESKFAGIYLDAYKREKPCFNLPRREVEILLTGYSIPLRAKVIDRLHELEQQANGSSFRVPQSLPEALRLAAELAEKNEKLALENQDLTHERDGLSSVVGSKMHTVGRFARTIPQINSLAIKSDLQRLGYLYRNGGTYRIYRQYEHLFVEKFNNQYGSIDIFVTEKGKTLIASLADQKKLTMKKAYAA